MRILETFSGAAPGLLPSARARVSGLSPLHIQPLRAADVEAEALLVDVSVVEIARGVQIDLEVLWVVVLGKRPALVFGPLNLYDLSAKSAQPACRPGPRPHPAEIDDANTRQSLHRRDAFHRLLNTLDLLTQHLQRQPLVFRGGQFLMRGGERHGFGGKPIQIASIETGVGQLAVELLHPSLQRRDAPAAFPAPVVRCRSFGAGAMLPVSRAGRLSLCAVAGSRRDGKGCPALHQHIAVKTMKT